MTIEFSQKPTRKDFKDLDGMIFGRLTAIGYAGLIRSLFIVSA